MATVEGLYYYSKIGENGVRRWEMRKGREMKSLYLQHCHKSKQKRRKTIVIEDIICWYNIILSKTH